MSFEEVMRPPDQFRARKTSQGIWKINTKSCIEEFRAPGSLKLRMRAWNLRTNISCILEVMCKTPRAHSLRILWMHRESDHRVAEDDPLAG